MEPVPAFVNSLQVDAGLQDASIRSAFYQQVYCSTSLEDETQPLVYSVASVQGKYYDLKNSILDMKFRVKNSDDTDLIGTDDVAPTNLFGATTFKEANVYVNQNLVSSTSDYNLLAHVKTLLSYSLDYKNNELQNSIYKFDDAPKTIGEANESFKLRKKLVANSKLVEVAVPLFDDIFCCDRYIYSDVNLKVVLKRAAQELALCCTSDVKKYKIQIEHCVLHIRKIDVAIEIYSLHAQLFQHKALNYPYTKSTIRVAHFSSNTVNATVENIFNSQTLPELLCIAFMQTEAYNGKLSKNCLAFGRNDVSSLQVQVNNQQSEYNLLTVSDSEYVLAVEHLIKNLNLQQRSIGINRTNWITGNAFYVFRLYPNEQNGFNKSGNLSIGIKFGAGASQNTTLLAIGQAQSVLSISAKGVQVSSALQ